MRASFSPASAAPIRVRVAGEFRSRALLGRDLRRVAIRRRVADRLSRRLDIPAHAGIFRHQIEHGEAHMIGRGHGLLDCATCDAEGGFWFAGLTESQLYRFTPDGTLDRVIDVPISKPIRTIFGGLFRIDGIGARGQKTRRPLRALSDPAGRRGGSGRSGRATARARAALRCGSGLRRSGSAGGSSSLSGARRGWGLRP